MYPGNSFFTTWAFWTSAKEVLKCVKLNWHPSETSVLYIRMHLTFEVALLVWGFGQEDMSCTMKYIELLNTSAININQCCLSTSILGIIQVALTESEVLGYTRKICFERERRYLSVVGTWFLCFSKSALKEKGKILNK